MKKMISLLLLTILLFGGCQHQPKQISKKEIEKTEQTLYGLTHYGSTYEEAQKKLAPYLHSMNESTTVDEIPLYPYYLGGFGLGKTPHAQLAKDLKGLSQQEIEAQILPEIQKDEKELYGQVQKPKDFVLSEMISVNEARYFYVKSVYGLSRYALWEGPTQLVFYRRYHVVKEGDKDKIIDIQTLPLVLNPAEVFKGEAEEKIKDYATAQQNLIEDFFFHQEVSFSDEEIKAYEP